MIKKLKHITAIILLVIFPISAVGLNVSIHKCQHKGTYHFSLFELSSNSNHSDCCCSTCDNDHSVKHIQESGCETMIENEQHSEKHDSQFDEKHESEQNSFGMVKSESNSKQNECDKGTVNQTKNKEWFSPLKSSCCSNTYVNNAINVEITIVDGTKTLIILPILSSEFLLSSNFNSRILDNLFVKELKYPLKEPICTIISFIYFTSNNSGDDSDIPNPLFC